MNWHDARRICKIEVIPMPTVIIEGPRINLSRKRSLIQMLRALVASAYDWPLENIVVILRENPDENVARRGRLLNDGGKPRRSPQARRSSSDENK
jgi:4-oxalocrotonate tautomerase